MRENVRNVSRNRAGRERWEFALDGRQMAAVAVGALVIVGSAFVLGMNTGKGMASRASPPAAEASLDAFDQAHANLPTPPEPKSWEYEKLGKSRAPDAVTLAAPAPAPAPAPAAAPDPAPPAPQPAPIAAAPVTPAPEPPARAPAAPSAMDRAISAVGGKPAAAAADPRGASAFVIQIGASPNRAEADRMARQFASRGARVMPADVDGKRWYRVRLASTTYDNRSDAERALSKLSRETGLRGFVTAAR